MKKRKLSAEGVLQNRTAVSATLTVLIICAVIAINVCAYALTGIFGLYFSSPERVDLLSGATDSLFTEAISTERKITVTFCRDEASLKIHETGSLVYQTAKALEERYRDSGLFTLRFVNLITGIEETTGERLDLSKYKKDMRGNDTPINSSTVIFESGESYRTVTDTATSVGYSRFYTLTSGGSVYSFNGEEMITAMSLWVLSREHKVAYLTQNHGETADYALYSMLECAGYYVDVLNLRQREIPSDADLLIVSAPSSDFARGDDADVHTEIERLNDYMNRGGRLLVLFDPLVKKLTVFEEFLADYGFTLPSSTDSDGIFSRHLVKEGGNSIPGFGGMRFIASVPSFEEGGVVASDIKGAISRYGTDILVEQTAAIRLSGTAKPLLVSSSESVLVSAGEVRDTAGSYAIAAYNSVPVGTEGKHARIVLIPTVFLTSTQSVVNNGYANKNFVYATMKNLLDSTVSPLGCRSILTVNTAIQGMTETYSNLIFTTLCAIPLAIGLVGAVILRRRKNR